MLRRHCVKQTQKVEWSSVDWSIKQLFIWAKSSSERRRWSKNEEKQTKPKMSIPLREEEHTNLPCKEENGILMFLNGTTRCGQRQKRIKHWQRVVNYRWKEIKHRLDFGRKWCQMYHYLMCVVTEQRRVKRKITEDDTAQLQFAFSLVVRNCFSDLRLNWMWLAFVVQSH